ncbi:uncharacterized protein LOC142229864 [Haematobia irritans]|uniref:uncharacterized protein LOC142229864 n=1 Tax=Haematobia irritans TaxID=7368 RepID=UPI003F504AAF
MHVPSTTNESFSSQVRLPKIDLPTFCRDYLQWISYRDMFTSLVHKNHSLSNVQKYFYLRSSCKDKPLAIVNEYPASEASYELAWSALSRRYHNKRKICDTIFKKMFDIPASDASCESIKRILDTMRTCLSLLKTLDINCDNWYAILIHIIISKLDIQSCKEWEQNLKASAEIPKLEQLFTFLETTFRTLESTRRVHVVSHADENCQCCGKRHLLYNCFAFAALHSNEKRELISFKGICRNCLNSGHMSKDCRLESRCQICRLPHHTIVHNEYGTNSITSTSSSGSATDEPTTAGNTVIQPNINCNMALLNSTGIPNVLLATVCVIVQSPYGNFKLRAILNQRAQATLITKSAAKRLRLKSQKTMIRINGVGGNEMVIQKFVNFSLMSNSDKDFKLNARAFVMPSLTTYHPGPISTNQLPDLSGYNLADPQFQNDDQIDLLIGGDLYGDILLPEQRKLDQSVFLQLTRFGWVVSGSTCSFDYSDPGININIFTRKEHEILKTERNEILQDCYQTT